MITSQQKVVVLVKLPTGVKCVGLRGSILSCCWKHDKTREKKYGLLSKSRRTEHVVRAIHEKSFVESLFPYFLDAVQVHLNGHD